MSSTSIAIAASAGAASYAASKAHEAECVAIEKTYDPHIATVEQKQDYADCINTLYPQDMGGTEVMFLKVCVALLLLSIPVGAIYGGMTRGTPFSYSVLFLLFTLIAEFVLLLIILAISFLIS